MNTVKSALKDRRCVQPREGDEPLREDRVKLMKKEIHPDWELKDGHHLERTFRTKDFRDALGLTISIGKRSEKAGHHPDISLSWGKVKVTLWTHKIGGLSENDFILAAKIDDIKTPASAF
ncbi:MAG: 4a-hydroxytetrahydrobiopterin dehydratase [Spirochaetales bacterium]|nr:4a-hydroxytetrahydrobiopterin dehydratase [Spirochaetales bacterium]